MTEGRGSQRCLAGGPRCLAAGPWLVAPVSPSIPLTDVAGSRISVRPVVGLPLLHVERPEFTGSRRVAKGLVAAETLDALAKLVSRLTSACKTDDERTMVEQFLVRNQSWSSVASQLGKNETAAKVAFSRLRQRLLEQVMEPLRFTLSGPEWAVIQSVCIERRSLADAATRVGSSPQHIVSVFQTRVLPALRAEYGAAGIESLIRLIGKLRTDDNPEKKPGATAKP